MLLYIGILYLGHRSLSNHALFCFSTFILFLELSKALGPEIVGLGRYTEVGSSVPP